MSKAIFFLLAFLFIVFSLLISSFDCYNYENNETRIIMFVFGESLYDPGNSNFLINRSKELKADYWPYGETFFHFPIGRFCDGRIIPDFLAMKLGLSFLKPYLGPNGTFLMSLTNGANFASAGARVISRKQPDTVIDLPEQVSFFEKAAKELRRELGEEKANKTLMEAMYLISIGGVDYGDLYSEYSNSTEAQQQLIQLVIENLTMAIKRIYKLGGRKFALQNVRPMGCTPKMKEEQGLYGTDKCVEELVEMSKRHNVALLEAAKSLESKLRGLKYSIFDYYSTMYDIIKNHTKYDFKVEGISCCAPEIGSICGVEPFGLCSNASEYVYFDRAHPTERVNEMVSELMWNGGPIVSVPRNFKQLSELNTTMSGWNFDTATINVNVAIDSNVATM